MKEQLRVILDPPLRIKSDLRRRATYQDFGINFVIYLSVL
jgi:hypothetical protein